MPGMGVAERRFREGSGEKYLLNGEMRCQGISVSQIRKWREAHNDYDTPNEDLWPECQCHQPAVDSMYVCRFHGGHQRPKMVRTLMDAIPIDMQDKFRAMMEDPVYISLREDIALMRTRMISVLESINEGVGNPEAWGYVSDALYELRRGNEDVAEERLVTALKEAAQDRQAWEEIREIQKLLKDTKGMEVKTAATLKTMATAEEVSRLIARVLDILTRGAEKYIDGKIQQTLFLTYVSGELARAVNFGPVAVGGLLEAGSREIISDTE